MYTTAQLPTATTASEVLEPYLTGNIALYGLTVYVIMHTTAQLPTATTASEVLEPYLTEPSLSNLISWEITDVEKLSDDFEISGQYCRNKIAQPLCYTIF
ncbi:hypothetical protein J6590_083004 [Homalodisca vitripennis]|nr:hypothetical protein J6590_083004 [Homalodisca vitripennis]